MNKMTLAKALIPSLLLAVPSVNAALLTNEGFETPVLTSNTSSDLRDINGNTALASSFTGWTVEAATGTPTISLVNGDPGSLLGLTPVEGSQYLSFNGAGGQAGGKIWQSFTTSIGQEYTVSYSVGRSGLGGGGDTVSLEAKVNNAGNTTQNTSKSELSWTSQSFTFTASATSTILSFVDVSTAALANYDLALDGVSISAVPEPSSYAAMFGIGLVGVASVRRFRMNQGVVRA